MKKILSFVIIFVIATPLFLPIELMAQDCEPPFVVSSTGSCVLPGEDSDSSDNASGGGVTTPPGSSSGGQGSQNNTANKGYQLLENLPGIGSGGFVTAGENSLNNFLNSAFRLGITVAIILSVIMVVIGGIQYMSSESPFDLGSAKERWVNVAWGLFIALGIYLLLNTINPDLVSLKLRISSVQVPAGATTSGGGGTAPERSTDERLAAILATENSNRSELRLANVFVNVGPCTQYGQSGCTNVGGLPRVAMDGLKSLARVCGTRVWVTGGTEWWLHRTHGPERPIVDIAKPGSNAGNTAEKQTLYDCLRGRFLISDPVLRLGLTYTDSGLDASFYNEDTAHFHVNFGL